MTAISRNLARVIWVSVAIPMSDDPSVLAKGKTAAAGVGQTQLRKRKVDALRLVLSFVFATKHYLRGEDGVNWADYRGVLPASFTRYDDATITGYSATASPPSGSRDASIGGRGSPDLRPDATKRVRVKRSKQQLADHSTPLLGEGPDNAGYIDELSLPLPLMYDKCFFLFPR